jgi:hypothetical protein
MVKTAPRAGTKVTEAQVCVPVQLPVWQVSPLVQLLPSSQVVPSDLVGFEQSPVD